MVEIANIEQIAGSLLEIELEFRAQVDYLSKIKFYHVRLYLRKLKNKVWSERGTNTNRT